MLGRHVHRVHPQGDEWIVSKDGEEAPRGNFAIRDQAIAAAERLGRSDQPARIMIDNDDGSDRRGAAVRPRPQRPIAAI